MANSQKTKEKKSKKVIVIILIIPVVTAAVLVSLYLYAEVNSHGATPSICSRFLLCTAMLS